MTSSTGEIRPFRIDIEDAALRDLRERLVRTRLPDQPQDIAWEQGTDLRVLRQALSYWQDGFDWRQAEAGLNAWPQFKVEIDGLDIHFVHLRCGQPGAMPLLLTHGWPGSFAEFTKIIPLLTQPGAGPVFDVVVPSLPGYGFSSRPGVSGANPRVIAGLWRRLMLSLGYRRFMVQGGDWGASVSTWLAHDAPDEVIGCHLNFIPSSFTPPHDASGLSIAERDFLSVRAAWADDQGAYGHIHGTRPQTLAYALTDSPAGLLGWILEKFAAWTDGAGAFDAVSLDEVLTIVSIYWFTASIGSSMRLYWETRRRPLSFAAGESIRVPAAVAHFPAEIFMPPREWVARVFTDLRRWTVMPVGGHFAALEQPALLADDIRAFAGSLSRPSQVAGATSPGEP